MHFSRVDSRLFIFKNHNVVEFSQRVHHFFHETDKALSLSHKMSGLCLNITIKHIYHTSTTTSFLFPIKAGTIHSYAPVSDLIYIYILYLYGSFPLFLLYTCLYVSLLRLNEKKMNKM